VARSGTLSFLPGVTELRLNISVLGDTIYEGTETFHLSLLAPTGPALLDPDLASATGRIEDNDPRPWPLLRFATESVALTEGHSGSKGMRFTVTLSEAATETVRVTFATADGSAVAGQDYTARSGTLTFAPGETRRDVNITVLGDLTVEADERFYLELGSVTGAALLDPDRRTAFGVIVNDDAETRPSLRFVRDAAESVELDSGQRGMVFTVELTASPLTAVRATVATANGSARAGEDYLAREVMLSFQPGQTRRDFVVTILGDTLVEGVERFYAEILAVTGPAAIDPYRSFAIGTIHDNDTLF
jgi:chitinase